MRAAGVCVCVGWLVGISRSLLWCRRKVKAEQLEKLCFIGRLPTIKVRLH